MYEQNQVSSALEKAAAHDESAPEPCGRWLGRKFVHGRAWRWTQIRDPEISET
jgi:hypothetical protein